MKLQKNPMNSTCCVSLFSQSVKGSQRKSPDHRFLLNNKGHFHWSVAHLGKSNAHWFLFIRQMLVSYKRSHHTISWASVFNGIFKIIHNFPEIHKLSETFIYLNRNTESLSTVKKIYILVKMSSPERIKKVSLIFILPLCSQREVWLKYLN